MRSKIIKMHQLKNLPDRSTAQPLEDYIRKELKKCLDSPYYFATNYLMVTNNFGRTVRYETVLTEKEFNNYFKTNNNEKTDKSGGTGK